MAALARRQATGSLTSAETIAEEEGIPPKFLEAILTQLKKAGLVESRRGPSGGFMLVKPADEVSLALVIRVLDGPFAPTPCSRTRNPIVCEGCEDLGTCRLRPFMREVRDAMAEVWEHRSVQDLVKGFGRVKKVRHAAM